MSRLWLEDTRTGGLPRRGQTSRNGQEGSEGGEGGTMGTAVSTGTLGKGRDTVKWEEGTDS